MRINCADVAARIHADMCDNDNNGYSQNPRWGEDGAGPRTITIDGLPYTYNQGSYDCSSSVIKAWQLAIQYTPYKGKLDGATYTGNMREVFERSGLFYSSTQDAKRGDIYLNDVHHTALCQDGGHDGVYGFDCMSQFSISENGTTIGQVGDQTGREAYVGPYKVYSKGWPNKLCYNGKADCEYEGESNTNKPGKTIDEVALEVIDGKWGVGDDRKNRLIAAGYDYQEVQNRVNAILSAPAEKPNQAVYAMKGIDVSSWNGAPFNTITENAYRESDFVIVKATQGTTYTNPCYSYARDRAIADGKALGVYHYAAGDDPEAEAIFFAKCTSGMRGKAIPVIDWEKEQNKAFGDTNWVRRFVDAFHAITSVWPMIYVSASVIPQVANCVNDCKLWVAGYPSNSNTSWIPSTFTYNIDPWDNFTIWQYSSVDGVDRNVATITREEWDKLAAVPPQESVRIEGYGLDFLKEIFSDLEFVTNKIDTEINK